MDEVDVTKLKACLKAMSESLKTTKEDEIIKDLGKTTVLKTNAKENLETALKALVSKYKDLEDLIKKYSNIADQIESYQDYGDKIDELEKSIASENSKEEPDESYISSLNSSISSYEKKRNDLKKSIDESI